MASRAHSAPDAPDFEVVRDILRHCHPKFPEARYQLEQAEAALTRIEEAMIDGFNHEQGLVEQYEVLKRHDEAATQDAVTFRRQLVDTQEQYEDAKLERDGLVNTVDSMQGIINDLEEQYAALEAHDERLSELNTEMATELDRLTRIEEQLQTAERQRDLLRREADDLKRINSEIVDVNTEACNRADGLLEQYQAARDVLVRLRQWDMMVGGIGADGEHHEATADAPYWRDQIDRALSFPASSPSSSPPEPERPLPQEKVWPR